MPRREALAERREYHAAKVVHPSSQGVHVEEYTNGKKTVGPVYTRLGIVHVKSWDTPEVTLTSYHFVHGGELHELVEPGVFRETARGAGIIAGRFARAVVNGTVEQELVR